MQLQGRAASSLLAPFFLGRGNHTGKKSSSSCSVVALQEDREDDPSVTTTASFSSQRSCSLSSTSCSSETATALTTRTQPTIRTGCLKYRTQLESLQHVYGTTGTDAASTTIPSVSIGVHWGTVQIHSHGVILGANPAVSHGPPVTIEWDSFDNITLSLEHYESDRNARPHRRGRSLLLPLALRHDMIQRSDDDTATHREVLMVIGEMDQIRQQRARTAQRVELHHAVKERILRSFFLRAAKTPATVAATS